MKAKILVGGQFALLGLLYPLVIARVRRLTIRHARWGRCDFGSDLRTRSVYGIYIIAGLLAVLIGGVIGGGFAGLAIATSQVLGPAVGDVGPYLLFAAGVVGYGVVIAFVAAYTRSRITNLMFGSAWIEHDTRPFRRLSTSAQGVRSRS